MMLSYLTGGSSLIHTSDEVSQHRTRSSKRRLDGEMEHFILEAILEMIHVFKKESLSQHN